VASPTAVHDVGLMQLTVTKEASPPVGDAGIGVEDQVPPLHASAKAADPVSNPPVAMQNPAPAHDTDSNSGEVRPGGVATGLLLHEDPFHCSARS
jgi:hypothetical protein